MTSRNFAVFVGLLSSLLAGSLLGRELSGVTVPDRIDVAGKELILNGMGIRKATVLNIKVYVAALYVEERSKDAERIIRSAETKRLVLGFKRDVDRERVVETIDERFRKNAGKNAKALSARLVQLERWLTNMKAKDTLTFTYGPGPAVEIQINGIPKGTIPGDDFGQALWSVWLGKDPPDEDLKKSLLGVS